MLYGYARHVFARMFKDPKTDITDTHISETTLQNVLHHVLEEIDETKRIINGIPQVDCKSPQEMNSAEEDVNFLKQYLKKLEDMRDKIVDEIKNRSEKRKQEDDDDDTTYPNKKSKTAGVLGGKSKSRRILKGLKNKKFRKTCRKFTRKSR